MSARAHAPRPPLAPAAETWARTTVLSNMCTTLAVRLHSASTAKNASYTPARLSRENRFPHAVPRPEPFAQRPPGDIVNGEVAQGLQKQPVVPALRAAQRQAGAEHIQRQFPIPFRHPRGHRQPSQGRLSMNQTSHRSGIAKPSSESIRPHGLVRGGVCKTLYLVRERIYRTRQGANLHLGLSA